MRCARNVRFQIKSGKQQDFTRLFNAEVLPLLKKQKGFKEEIALVSRDHALGISLWDDRASAEAYQNSAYPQVLHKLNPVLEGAPRVEMYEVVSTTLSS